MTRVVTVSSEALGKRIVLDLQLSYLLNKELTMRMQNDTRDKKI